MIRARTGEGRTRAKARGVHMGRPPTLTARQRAEAINALRTGIATQADLARRFAVSQSTISRLVEKAEAVPAWLGASMRIRSAPRVPFCNGLRASIPSPTRFFTAAARAATTGPTATPT